VPVVVDAGIGAPSHAAEAMNWAPTRCCEHRHCRGNDPERHGCRIQEAVEAGRAATKWPGAVQETASPTSPLTAF